MIDALVVQVSQASESIPQYALLDRGGDCRCLDQLQVRVEERVYEHVTIGNAVNKRSDVGRAVDELLQLQDVLKVTRQDVLEYILLTLVAGIERESEPTILHSVRNGGQEPCKQNVRNLPRAVRPLVDDLINHVGSPGGRRDLCSSGERLLAGRR